jgi:hypothetical protein
VRCMANKMTLGQFFLNTLSFPCPFSFHQHSIFICHQGVVQKTHSGLQCQVTQSHPTPMMTGMKGLTSTKHLSNLIYKYVVNNLQYSQSMPHHNFSNAWKWSTLGRSDYVRGINTGYERSSGWVGEQVCETTGKARQHVCMSHPFPPTK